MHPLNEYKLDPRTSPSALSEDDKLCPDGQRHLQDPELGKRKQPGIHKIQLRSNPLKVRWLETLMKLVKPTVYTVFFTLVEALVTAIHMFYSLVLITVLGSLLLCSFFPDQETGAHRTTEKY